MTAVQPPGFLQALNNHSAYTMRRNTMLLMDGATWRATIPRGGVHPAYGGTLDVTGSASVMQVTVATGMAAIPHSQAFGGLYSVYNDGNVTLSVDAADATQYRRDLVIAEILDTNDGDGSDLWQLRVVKGTLSASPPAPLPTKPAKAEVLAAINVDPAITSLSTKIDSTVTIGRRYIPTIGGTLLSGGDSDRVVPARAGMLNTQADQGIKLTYWDGGAWRFVADQGWQSYTPAVTGFGSGTFSSRIGRYKIVGEKTAVVSIFIKMANAGTGTGQITIGLPLTPNRAITEQLCVLRFDDNSSGPDFMGVAVVRSTGSGAKFDIAMFPASFDSDVDIVLGNKMTAGSQIAIQGTVELA